MKKVHSNSTGLDQTRQIEKDQPNETRPNCRAKSFDISVVT